MEVEVDMQIYMRHPSVQQMKNDELYCFLVLFQSEKDFRGFKKVEKT